MIDNETHALGEYKSSRQIINKLFKELDPESRSLHDISIDQTNFGAQDWIMVT